jgi:hypothetical protein
MSSLLHWFALWLIASAILGPFIGKFIAYGMGSEEEEE